MKKLTAPTLTEVETIKTAVQRLKAYSNKYDHGYLIARINPKSKFPTKVTSETIQIHYQRDFGIWNMSADEDGIIGVVAVFTDTAEPKWEMNMIESMTFAWNEYWRKKCRTA